MTSKLTRRLREIRVAVIDVHDLLVRYAAAGISLSGWTEARAHHSVHQIDGIHILVLNGMGVEVRGTRVDCGQLPVGPQPPVDGPRCDGHVGSQTKGGESA
jgi:hypothetical protein